MVTPLRQSWMLEEQGTEQTSGGDPSAEITFSTTHQEHGTEQTSGVDPSAEVNFSITHLKSKDPSPFNPRHVSAKIFVTNLGKIDSTSNDFEIAFTLQMLYHDPHLLEVDDPELEERSDWDDPAWLDVTPSVQRYKDISLEQVQVWVLVKEHLILREYKARGTVVSTLDLRSFPFDVQELKVTIESDAYPAHALKYVDQHKEARKAANDSGMEKDPFLLARDVYKHTEFRILRAQVATGYAGYDFEVGGLDPDQYLWSRYELQILVHRRSGHYISKLGAVLVLSMLMSMAAHAFPVSALSDRLGLITTVFLTAVAFQFLVADTLPKIPYWTTFDRCVAFVYLILLVTMVETVVLHLAQKLDKDFDESANSEYEGIYWDYNLYCAIANLVMFGLWLLAVVIIAYRSETLANHLARPMPTVSLPRLPDAVKGENFESA